MLIRKRRGWELPEGGATPRRCSATGGGCSRGWARARCSRPPRPCCSVEAPLPPRAGGSFGRPLSGAAQPALSGRGRDHPAGDHQDLQQLLRVRLQQADRRGRAGAADPAVDDHARRHGRKEQTIEIDDLLARMPLEERVVRHRCVEAWSMIVPWSGFPLAKLIELARPLGSARFVELRTFEDPDVAAGQRQFWYPWPYLEGLTIAEATHELAFMVTGAYGKPLPKSNGSPLRLAVPWKYGFKHVKSIQRITFTDRQPAELLGGDRRRRVRLLGQRQPRGAASALEPGDRGADRHRRARPDAIVQRLPGVRRRPLSGPQRPDAVRLRRSLAAGVGANGPGRSLARAATGPRKRTARTAGGFWESAACARRAQAAPACSRSVRRPARPQTTGQPGGDRLHCRLDPGRGDRPATKLSA